MGEESVSAPEDVAEIYRRKNGTARDMTPLPLPFELGVPGIGGPIIKAGGVTFLAPAVDDYLRAYDLTTGDQLWQARLPAGGQSTPMTYGKRRLRPIDLLCS